VCLGDSLTAGLGVSSDQAYPAQLAAYLRSAGLDYEVVNAGVSGDTSAGGLRRLEWSMAGDVQVLVVALGANDGLRGLPLGQMRDNLALILRAAQKSGSRVLLVGMKMPPNYGPQYTQDFEQAYIALARQFKCALAPFLLDGVAGKRELFLDDNLHPAAQAQPIILENVWKGLAPMLK
jgi:acyl-CoA thioesterase-1